MALLAKRINLDMTDEMVTFSALSWVENFKLSNKHLYLLAKHLGLMTKKIPVVDSRS